MTADEIIVEVRAIARELDIYRPFPGDVLPAIRQRVMDFLVGVPFAPWFKKGRRYLTTQGDAMFNGQPATIPVLKTLGGIDAVIDDTAVEVCKAIIAHLMVAQWELMVECDPNYRDWTPDIAEAAIRKSAKVLPELCDMFQKLA